MKVERSPHFVFEFHCLPASTRQRVSKALKRYDVNPLHPGLRLKKMKGKKNMWEMRVSRGYRITFSKMANGIFLRHVGTHDILRKE